jgi:cytochrome c2
MRNAALITVSSLVLALAACGGGAQEEEQASVTEEAAVPAAGATGAAETVAGEAGETEAEATPSPTPSPSASAAPSPTPSPAAAVAAVTAPPAFALCRACHSTEAGENGIGPSLAGVFGAKSAHLSSFDYSEAMEGAGLTWNEATLNRYLENPTGVVPGTTMSFAGVRNEAQRKAIVEYLKTL